MDGWYDFAVDVYSSKALVDGSNQIGIDCYSCVYTSRPYMRDNCDRDMILLHLAKLERLVALPTAL